MSGDKLKMASNKQMAGKHKAPHRFRQRFSPFIPNIGSCLLALLVGALLFRDPIIIGAVSTIILFGIDEQRALLIAALLMTAGAPLTGAAVGKRKFGAVLGAGAVFVLGYLIGFLQNELQPAFDMLGNLEPLNGGALVHTAFVMVALALLSAFIGAAVGIALGEVLLNPLFTFARFVWQRQAATIHNPNTYMQGNSTSSAQSPASVRGWLLPGLAALALIAVVVLASSGGNLFIYAPDVGLHLPPAIHHPQVTGPGTIVHDAIVSPALGGQKKEFLVYLPPSYNTVRGRAKRYPTLYLLHGSPGHDSDWLGGGNADQSADTLIALGKIPELIMILPDGNGRPGQTSEWGNSYDQRQKMETYVATDLVNYVDAKYRTIADAAHRGIAGLSMGGFGAMNIAAHHPNIFGYVASLGGYYRAEGSIWGNNAAYMRYNSPIDVLPTDKQAWHLHIFIGAATKDQPYYTDAKEFVQELINLHIPYQLDVEVGSHSWHVWQIQLYHTLLWLHWGS